ncbi:ATP-binding protein [Aeromonas schubertii]|uniref:ATP-binding protein n=1 Tax=Aeromonas TaxID=642 RepID=UPI00067EC73D|nr:ATP-binding protein [Aeromonas schubertii]KUE79620.1 histidine kinase [Aeromonas schubertii]MBZ6072391.1 sensor histidine kinase [Aeromonas schubertii]QCG49287.1 ATP-binding protein [Aeromonas schubertii]
MRVVRTLRGRLLVIALIWCGLFLFATGFSLQRMLTNYWQQAEADGLRLQLFDLLSRLELGEDGLPMLTEPLADPRFRQPYSGFYWQLEAHGQVVAKSRSLWDSQLVSERLRPAFGDKGLFLGKGPGGEPLLLMTRSVLLPGSDLPLRLVMAKDSSVLNQTLKKTRLSLFFGLGFAAAGLILGFLFQVLYGLRPLHLLRRELARIHQGHQEKFEQRYPLEIQPLVEDINRLLHHYGELLSRARSHTGNLAHALKTPLSILRNQVPQLPPAEQPAITEQLDQIQRHIDYHLGKARVTGAAKVLGVSTPLRARIEYICRAFSRLYPGRELAIDVPATLAVGVEEQDFDEMVGNLLENAYKWSSQRIRVSTAELGGWITLRIEDDGPGMTEDQMARAIERGVRLDEKVPGSGLGLNIVSDLAEAYRGNLIMGRAELGGLAACLSLPKVARIER